MQQRYAKVTRLPHDKTIRRTCPALQPCVSQHSCDSHAIKRTVKPVSHQPCGSRAPICDETFLGFVRQPHGVVNNTARLPYKPQGRKAAATNFRHVHFLCDLFAFSERRTTAARHTRLPQDCCKTHKVFVRLT